MSFLNRSIVKLEDGAALPSYASQVCLSLRSDRPLQNSPCFCENISRVVLRRYRHPSVLSPGVEKLFVRGATIVYGGYVNQPLQTHLGLDVRHWTVRTGLLFPK